MITLFLSIFINGKDIGLDPVAIIHLLNVTLAFFSAIFNVLLLTKDALPSNTVICFYSLNNQTFNGLLNYTVFPFNHLFKVEVNFPEISIP